MWQIKQHWLCLGLQILRLVLICAQSFHQLWCSRRVPLLLCDADDLNIVAMAYKWHWRQVWQRSARWPVVYRWAGAGVWSWPRPRAATPPLLFAVLCKFFLLLPLAFLNTGLDSAPFIITLRLFLQVLLRRPERFHQMAKHSFVSALVLLRLASYWVRNCQGHVMGRHTYNRGFSSFTVLSLIVQLRENYNSRCILYVVILDAVGEWLQVDYNAVKALVRTNKPMYSQLPLCLSTKRVFVK